MQENNNQGVASAQDNKVDAVAAVVLILAIAGMMIMWVASH